MFNQYWKQAIASLRENPLISFLTILGTTLCIALLLVLMLTYQIRTASYSPVSNRSNLLYVSFIEGRQINSTNNWRGALGNRIVREGFYNMETPAVVSAVSSDVDNRHTTVSGVKNNRESAVRLVDANFWKIFDVRFITGKPFTEEMFQSAVPVAVIDEQVARELYNTTEVAGKTIQLDYIDYTISGVIRTVSKAANEVYGEVWIPYTTDKIINSSGAEGICGSLVVNILIDPSTNANIVKEEVRQRIDAYNKGQAEYVANIIGQPVNGFRRMFYNLYDDRLNGQFSGMLVLAVLFFLLPVLNLLGITFSQIRKRQPEIGLRKAFGATTPSIIIQMFFENLITTMIGAVAGIVLSILFFILAKDGLIGSAGVALQPEMLIRPGLFISAVFICLMINTMSAGIPAWYITKMPLIDSLNKNLQSNK